MGRDLNDLVREHGPHAGLLAADGAPIWLPPVNGAPNPRTLAALRPLSVVRGLGPEETARELVIKGLFGRGELSAVYGPPKSGKSFLVTSAALAVAAGDERWFGHRLKQCGQILYIALEGASGFRGRLDAWSRHRQCDVPSNFVRTSERLCFLGDPTAANAASDVERIKAAALKLEAETGEPVVLIVVDTVARAMAGGDENSAQDMGRFLAACGALQALPSRPHVAVVHHAGKDGERGTRGSTALPAGVDTLVRVERVETGNQWCVQWAKDDPETEWRGFALESVDLGQDDDGDPVTSCVVVEADAPQPPSRKRSPRPTGTNQKLVWRALEEVERDSHREKRPQMLEGVPYAAVTTDALRERAYALADWPADKRWDRFEEALRGLVAGSFVSRDDGNIWVWRTDAKD